MFNYCNLFFQMFNRDFNSIDDIENAFPNEQVCVYHLEDIRWNRKIVSPFDVDSKVYNCKGNKYKCKNTGKYFNVKTGTIFDNSKIPLQKWFLAIWVLSINKNNIYIKNLKEHLQVSPKTFLFMSERINSCFNND